MKIENKVADTILQREQTIKVGLHTYHTAPPCIATIILASEIIADLPDMDMSANVVEEGLRKAKDFRKLGQLMAVLILGAKRSRNRLRRNRLAKRIMEELTPRELHILIAKVLAGMQLSDFFGLTTFLAGINLTKPTRKVENSTTASGQ